MAKPVDAIGGWTLHHSLGGGGQGKVFAASCKEGEPEAAIKIIKCRRPKKKARFMQEISVHAALASQGASNIIPILDHNLEELKGGGIRGYLVMPMAVTTLEKEKDLLRGRTELCVEVFRGVVTGIGHAHAAEVVHRDIKPSNVLFLDKTLKQPQVSDFGIAFLRETPDAERLTDVGETVGAKFFMAPEQERGGVVDVGPSADIYALGKLLHHMLTGKFLYRESIAEAFTEEELRADPRLLAVRDRILSVTIVEDPSGRLQSTDELLKVLNEVMTPPSSGSSSITPENERPEVSMQNESQETRSKSELDAYNDYINVIVSGSHQKIRLEFDLLKHMFKTIWQTIYDGIRNTPKEAPAAAHWLIKEQPQATALVLAIGRCDSKDLFRPVKLFLQFLTKASEGRGGYLASTSVPDVQAGFLYMAMSIVTLENESWNILHSLLTEKFEWYYQSGRPLYSYGFAHTYFFHPETINRSASKTHDFYREQLAEDSIMDQLGLKADALLTAYIQAQFLMSLRGSQCIEKGEDVPVWPDFGRFHGYRLESLLDRIFHDDYYAEGILRSFEETREQFFERLNNRLSLLSNRFSGNNYFWDSIKSWEPRD